MSSVRDAALTLFAQRGYHGTALSLIAKELGIRTPSLYNHMTSKQELLEDVMISTTEAVMSEFEKAVAQHVAPSDRLRAAVEVYVRRHLTHRREAVIVNRDVSSLEDPARTQVLARRRDHEHAVRAIIGEGVDSGEFSTQNPTLSSFAILEMCVSVARWYDPAGPVPVAEMISEYGTYALRIVGVGTPSS